MDHLERDSEEELHAKQGRAPQLRGAHVRVAHPAEGGVLILHPYTTLHLPRLPHPRRLLAAT